MQLDQQSDIRQIKRRLCIRRCANCVNGNRGGHVKHLNVRVAWHDNKWNGTVCKDPIANTFCTDLKRVRKYRNEAVEVKFAGKEFSQLPIEVAPPCMAESAAFMNTSEWMRRIVHPYASSKNTEDSHGHLLPTDVKVPPHSTFAVPFYWMLRGNQNELDERLPTPLTPDEKPPFASAWVFSNQRQVEINEYFFGHITEGRSLVSFYTKAGHPLEEINPRLIVGIGTITRLWPVQKYETSTSAPSYPLWDRMFEHSIRAKGVQGFLLPYHDYLEPTGNGAEDIRRRSLLSEIVVVPEAVDTMSFSYAGELSGPDVALSVLVKCLASVRKIREHGIAEGPWEAREDWLNKQIAATWEDRGAFPGVGSALEGLGLRLGTALVQEMSAREMLHGMGDPWPLLDQMIRGIKEPPQAAYAADLSDIKSTWVGLSAERLALLRLLSMMSISPKQAKRWFDPRLRAKSVRTNVSDADILANPYRIAEVDLGDRTEHPIGMGVIDRAMLPEDKVAVAHPVEAPSLITSGLDPRRMRAALVSVLRAAADDGDSLLGEDDAAERLIKLDVARPCLLPADWLNGNENQLIPEISRLGIILSARDEVTLPCIQLTELAERERKLSKVLLARADKSVNALAENWQKLLIAAIAEGGGTINEEDPRHGEALAEQADALNRVTSRKLSVLVGRAGTGKTTVLGALMKSDTLRKGGVLFLAPTGKARVRLAQKANANAMTVAQFLHKLKRYDAERQRPKFTGDKYRAEKTVVIDECSMLTMDDLLATLEALDLAHVERVILVGDPNQLPPIGVGRPFTDLVAHLDTQAETKATVSGALARLTIELRTAAGGPSDTLRLASWFTREQQAVDADRVLSDIESGFPLNDLVVTTWKNHVELRARIEEQFVAQMGLSDGTDVEGFNLAMGLTKEGWVPFDDHNGAERFQILSPVRRHNHGVSDLNRWIQGRFRAAQLKSSRARRGLSLGDEEIVWGDKVILTRNGDRQGYNHTKKELLDEYLANGEIGTAKQGTGGAKGKFLNVAFANRPDITYSFNKQDFPSNSAPLELAYALTVHKAQGSEFGIVFAIIPKATRFLTRELAYTALTRSKSKLVLFVEGDDPTALYELSKPSNSGTARRNTHLFAPGVRRDQDTFAYAEHLVHRTVQGIMVQSKSELAISNYCATHGLEEFSYNRPLQGTKTVGKLRPDFTFTSDSGEVVLWEHLGMLDRADYAKSWEWKKEWYRLNEFVEGKNLFTTSEGPGLDMDVVATTAKAVKSAIANI